MKIKLIAIGKTDKSYLKDGIEIFTNRIPHYISFDFCIIPDIKNTKNMSYEQQKLKEGELILSQLSAGDELILLDEKGKELRSVDFANYIEKKMITSTKTLIFCIGGPYGFSEDVYNKACGKISLSKMTFSHQMVRLIFCEQLYRAMSILNGEPYHHE